MLKITTKYADHFLLSFFVLFCVFSLQRIILKADDLVTLSDGRRMWLNIVQQPKHVYWQRNETNPEMTVRVNTAAGLKYVTYKRLRMSDTDIKTIMDNKQAAWKRLSSVKWNDAWALQTWNKHPLPIIIHRDDSTSESQLVPQIIKAEENVARHVNRIPVDTSQIEIRAKHAEYPNVYLRQLRSANHIFFVMTKNPEVIVRLPCMDLVTTYKGLEGTYAPITGITRRFNFVYKLLNANKANVWTSINEEESISVLNNAIPWKHHKKLVDGLLHDDQFPIS